MSEQQPEAWRLADRLGLYARGDEHQRDTEDASVELLRLYELNQELFAALASCVKVLAHGATTPERQAADPLSAMNVGLALIARAGGVPSRCPLCGYQHGHAIGCENNPVDIALKARAGTMREDIIRMATEAGLLEHGYPVGDRVAGELERFAALVAADERIACAISCEVNAARWVDDMRKNYAAHECAAAIRARGAS